MNDAGMNPITVNDNMFTLVSEDGRTYAPDTVAEVDMMSQTSIIMETINPLEDVTGYLVFDMPTNMKPSDVKLQVQNGFNQVALSIS
ncbi:hypothetical protein GCM10025859_62060 [Alicyclobacillus fastidiosus]|nr:hypothetical protein GCM10025859_62060 [Alicyclobacillus fastidiosus]